MKLIVSSAALSARLQAVGRVIVSKNAMPILNCFCLETKGQSLVITASDSDTMLTSTLPLNECDQDVRFAVNAKTIQDALKEIPEQPLEFYLNTETFEVTVVYQNGKYTLMAQSADDYPVPVASEGEQTNLTLPSSIVASSVTRALASVSADKARPVFASVCFDFSDGALNIVSSDGDRLSLTSMKQDGLPNGIKYLLGARPATLLRGIVEKDGGDCIIRFGERDAEFRTEDFVLKCRLVDGHFPNYKSIIPQNNPNEVTLNRAAFISAMRRVLVFSDAGSVLVRFRIEASTLNISTQNVDFNKASEETMLCDYSGTPMTIAFKGGRLLELVQNLEADEISIKLSDPSRPGLIVPLPQPEGQEITLLALPTVFLN